MIRGPFECEGEWIGRAKWRSGGAVYRERIIAFMAGTEAEIELLDAAQGNDGEDRCQIALMAKEPAALDRQIEAGLVFVRRAQEWTVDQFDVDPPFQRRMDAKNGNELAGARFAHGWSRAPKQSIFMAESTSATGHS
jgi:hypothetical protein